MANAGLPRGFVRFGTTAHKILLYIYEAGESHQSDLCEQLDMEPREVGMILHRLWKHRFIRRIGKLDPYIYGIVAQWVYVLIHEKRGLLFKRYKNVKKTGAQRTAMYRHRNKPPPPAAPTAFDYRG